MRAAGFVARARDAGIAAVGARSLARAGHFLAPTVLRDVPPDAEVAREEVFGPVLAVTAFDDLDEAIALANDSAYGLAAHVDATMPPRTMPPRGWRPHGLCQLHPGGRSGLSLWRDESSGLGRENGSEVLDAYLEPKSGSWRCNARKKDKTA
jgi:aldehyde dehydrogenase (NAD+)/phenylacetaldehyde dehydrogenase